MTLVESQPGPNLSAAFRKYDDVWGGPVSPTASGATRRARKTRRRGATEAWVGDPRRAAGGEFLEAAFFRVVEPEGERHGQMRHRTCETPYQVVPGVIAPVTTKLS
jgi:hypothetical protein